MFRGIVATLLLCLAGCAHAVDCQGSTPAERRAALEAFLTERSELGAVLGDGDREVAIRDLLGASGFDLRESAHVVEGGGGTVFEAPSAPGINFMVTDRTDCGHDISWRIATG